LCYGRLAHSLLKLSVIKMWFDHALQRLISCRMIRGIILQSYEFDNEACPTRIDLLLER
jgi:hypothetical protein